MDEQILKPIDAMSDDELISIITVKRENFNDEYRNKALEELTSRGIRLEDILKVAEFKKNFDDFEKIEVSAADEKLQLLQDPFDVLYFKNYMDELLVVQRNLSSVALHHHNRTEGFKSFFVYDADMLKQSLNQFLVLGEWLPEDSEIIEHWETFVESGSKGYILRITTMLNDLEIDYSISNPHSIRFDNFSDVYAIVVPADQIDETGEIHTKLEELKEELHGQIEVAERNSDVDKQLELLTILETVTPDDSVLFYNKAQLFDSKGDFQNASNAAIESFNIELANGAIEDIEDTKSYLIDTLAKVENKKNILHCLATIASMGGENEVANEYFEQLVELDDKDAIAHLNLGHYYYSHSEDDEKVKEHFNKYLKLELEGDDRESVLAILENME